MKYKDLIRISMEDIAKNEKSIFIGYNTKFGSRAAGSLINVPDSKIIETPVAENLMVAMAIGLSLEGWKPVVYFERFDFILNAMDAIVNHLDKIEVISRKQYSPTIMIRASIGRKNNALFSGETHTQDFSDRLKPFVSFPVIKLPVSTGIIDIYKERYFSDESSMIVDEADNYEIQI